MQRAHADIVIIGGGIAGLWLLASLRAQGWRAVLIEKTALGAGQTLASQGIIHGGTKYALTGKLTGSSEAIRAMPGRWRQHLQGQAEPDLSAVALMTGRQWMWAAGGIGAKTAGFFASKVMSSRVATLDPAEIPSVLQQDLQGVRIYELDEPVLDVRSLLQVLAGPFRQACYQAEVQSVQADAEGCVLRLDAGGQIIELQAQAAIAMAGTGNAALLPEGERLMQRRPLHMVMVKGDLPDLWAHVIEANANPRLTVTTHRDPAGETVWYLGGQLAETGVGRTAKEHIQQAKKELSLILPSLDQRGLQWATLLIDRAEGQAGGKRPDEPAIVQQGRCLLAWPTKLAFAPLLAQRLQERLGAMALDRAAQASDALPLPQTAVGDYPWDSCKWMN